MQYNLEKRVIIFSKSIIQFIKNFKITLLSEPLLKQLIKSATSVGANELNLILAKIFKNSKQK
jgi:hypothetical protein